MHAIFPGRADMVARWTCPRPGCMHHNIRQVGINYPEAGERMWLQCGERECGEMSEFIVLANFTDLIPNFEEPTEGGEFPEYEGPNPNETMQFCHPDE